MNDDVRVSNLVDASRPDARLAHVRHRPGGHQGAGRAGAVVEKFTARATARPAAGPAIGFDMAGGDPSRSQTATALLHELQAAGPVREMTGRGSFRAFAI